MAIQAILSRVTALSLALPWWASSLGANASITMIEYLNRTAGYPTFAHALCHTAPLILLAQWGLYRSWSAAPSFLMAWLFFSMGNAVMRIISARFFVGEPISPATWVGVVLAIAATVVARFGDRWLEMLHG